MVAIVVAVLRLIELALMLGSLFRIHITRILVSLLDQELVMDWNIIRIVKIIRMFSFHSLIIGFLWLVELFHLLLLLIGNTVAVVIIVVATVVVVVGASAAVIAVVVVIVVVVAATV